MHDHYRRLELVEIRDRRGRTQFFIGAADFFGDVSAAKPAIGNVGFAFPALQVIDAGQPDRATVQLGFAHGAHERGNSTVTRAIAAEPIGIRTALRNRPPCSIAAYVDHSSVPNIPALYSVSLD